MQEHLPDRKDRKMKYPPSCAAIDAPYLSTDRHPFPSDYNFLLIPNFLRPVRKADSGRPHSPRILLSRKFPHFRAAAPQSSPTPHTNGMRRLRRRVHVHKRKGILHVLHRGKFIRRPSFQVLASPQCRRKFGANSSSQRCWREIFHLETWIFSPPLSSRSRLISSRLFFDSINGHPSGKSSILRRLGTVSWHVHSYGSWRGKWSFVLFRHCGLVVSLGSCDWLID